jgi:SAM-dependent methyltransferase
MADRDELIDRVEGYYSGRLADHGATHAGVDWNSRESQFARFDQLMRVAQREEHCSVNDYGCGYGALIEWLIADGRPFDYFGFDVSEAMTREASERHADVPQAHFGFERAEIEPADFTVASGIFNVKAGASEEEWSRYVIDEIDTLAALSRKGFAFNALTSYSDADHMREDLHYADPITLLEHVMSNHSRWSAMMQDYGLFEFTVVVRFDR